MDSLIQDDGPWIVIWETPEVRTCYGPFHNWKDTLAFAAVLDVDTSGDWFIEVLHEVPVSK